MVSSATSFPVQFNKAIVGKNAFAHESGIHQDGVLKHRETYEIMSAQSVGWNANKMVMGKHSGRAAFRDKLKALGCTMGQGYFYGKPADAVATMRYLADRYRDLPVQA